MFALASFLFCFHAFSKVFLFNWVYKRLFNISGAVEWRFGDASSCASRGGKSWKGGVVAQGRPRRNPERRRRREVAAGNTPLAEVKKGSVGTRIKKQTESNSKIWEVDEDGALQPSLHMLDWGLCRFHHMSAHDAELVHCVVRCAFESHK